MNPIKCADPDCDQTYVPHYWGKVKAAGWFFPRDGAATCPKHNPPWVTGWRAAKKARKR